MFYVYMGLICIAILAIGFTAGVFAGRRWVAPRVLSLVEQLREELAERDRRVAELERHKSEYLGMITVVQDERDTWQRHYYEMASGSDVAQSMLMRENTSLVLQYKVLSKGKLPKFDLTTAQLRAQFGQQYGEVARLYQSGELAKKMADHRAEETSRVQRIDPSPEKALVE